VLEPGCVSPVRGRRPEKLLGFDQTGATSRGSNTGNPVTFISVIQFIRKDPVVTLSIYNPIPPSKAEASEPADDVVKEQSQRQQMLRDLELFLSAQLNNAKSISLRLARRSRYGGKAVSVGAVRAE
jgi:hypothetical protein